ncbi:plasmid mobilization protein [Clostridium sp.]|uniref:plasmid mobilization protein n=1 Tax=Clostridium sp. TaxID=1506 RepID=UPI00290AFBA7|nr:hypothetical protein [Clostridium sp.]MDU7068011.1 hypothetical protein [Clostridium perfringens]
MFEYPKGHIKYDRKINFTILLGLGQSPPRPHPIKKSKLKQQEYLIKSALNKKIIVIDGLKEILLELSREGNNLKC